jgi:hypothetical protein
VNNMTQNHYVKYGTLSGLLLLCTILLNTAEDNPRLALAQITPAPEKFGSTEDSSTDSSPDTGDGNGDDQNDGSIGSSGADGDDDADGKGVSEGASASDEQQDEATEEDSTEISDSNDENDGQSTIEEPATSEGTNPLVEAIINQVNDVLSASGIPGL